VHRKKMHRHLVKQKYAHKIIRRDVWYHDIRKQWYNVASIRCFIFSIRRNFRICFHRLSATLFLHYSTQTKEKASSVLKMMDIIVWWYQLTKNRNEIKCKRSTYILEGTWSFTPENVIYRTTYRLHRCYILNET